MWAESFFKTFPNCQFVQLHSLYVQLQLRASFQLTQKTCYLSYSYPVKFIKVLYTVHFQNRQVLLHAYFRCYYSCLRNFSNQLFK